MPNVRGLEDAPTLQHRLSQGRSIPYGTAGTVSREGDVVVFRSLSQVPVATVDFSTGTPRVKVDLARVDGDVVTAVNALIKPFGKVKVYWRTGEYRWHPLVGMPSAPGVNRPITVKPVVAPAAPAVVASPAPVAPVVVPSPVTVAVQGPIIVATEKRHTGKQPVIRPVTKSYTEVGDVLIPNDQVDGLEYAWSARAAGEPGAVLITGPAGTAKTRLAEQFAFTKGVPFLKVSAQQMQTATDWYGGFVPNHEPGATSPFHWVWSDFANALRRGESMVILVDEINRAADAATLNGLFDILDWTAMVNPTGAPSAVSLPPGILIVATLNEGVEYVGTVEVDRALRDRFSDGVRMEYSPEVIDARIIRKFVPGIDKTVHGPDVCKRLVRVASVQRAKRDEDSFPSHSTISTRTLISIAGKIVRHPERTPAAAIWSSARAGFIPEDFDALRIVIESQFGPNPEPSDDLPDDDDVEAMLADI